MTILRNYYRYLPLGTTQPPWGCQATSFGYTFIPPGSNTPYPYLQHPVDHHFDWESGRTLSAYQIVYISQGAGSFESAETAGSIDIQPDTAFLLFPNVWHRYRPGTEHGWEEHWIELVGPAPQFLQKQGLLKPNEPIFHFGTRMGFAHHFHMIHKHAHTPTSDRLGQLATLGLHLLTLLTHPPDPLPKPPSRIDAIISQAQARIANFYDQPLNVEALAQEANIAYSYFRRAFKAHLGISPKQYQIHIRLRKADELLANTQLSIVQISELLGFHSPYHFSSQFKKHRGQSPDHWRRRSSKQN